MRLPVFVVGALVAVAQAAAGASDRVRFIYAGDDVSAAAPAEVLARADRLSALPLAGLVLGVPKTFQADGTSVSGATIATDPVWRRETLEPVVATYRGITAFPKLRCSFAGCRLDLSDRAVWNDDAAWTRIAGNFRELSAAAKDGGLKGLFIDLAVDPPCGAAAARRRARAVFSAVFSVYPEITLFFNRAFTDARSAAFLDGMLDVIPSTARFIEGDADARAYSASRGDFNRAAVRTLSDAVARVSRENRAKYRSQVVTSFGLCLDDYVSDGAYARPALNGSRAEHFRANLEAAVVAADGYVWLYGSRLPLVAKDGGCRAACCGTWDCALGLSRKLSLCLDREAYISRRTREIVASHGDERNLLGDTGAFTLDAADPAAAVRVFTLVDMTNRVPYLLSARVRGDVRAAAYWIRDGQWCWDVPPVWFVEAGRSEPDADGWREASVLVRGPADVQELSVQFSAVKGRGEVRSAALYRFDTDAPAGRLVPTEPRASALFSRPEMKRLFDDFPKLWRVDGDVVVFQNMVFSEQVIDLWKESAKDGVVK